MNTRRVLLKISGEALGGPNGSGLDPDVVQSVSSEIADIALSGTQVAIVMGAGNFFRGMAGVADGMDRVTADQMGMVATVINAMALGDSLNSLGAKIAILSAIGANPAVESYTPSKGREYLDAGRIVLCPGGTGNPFFTTDTAAVLRALELKCDLMLKATKVDGVYNKDPVEHDDAIRFSTLSYTEVLQRRLGVMDLTAVTLAEANGLDLLVFRMTDPGSLKRIIGGDCSPGTLIKAD